MSDIKNEDNDTAKSFIGTRLDSLNNIDSKIVSLLDQMTGIFDSYSTPSNNHDDTKQAIEHQTKTIYQTISDIAINLRKEVKIMDDNIGVFDRNDDNVMILPIPVEQKTTELGKKRLANEMTQLDNLIPEEPSEEQKFHAIDKTEGKEAEEQKGEQLEMDKTDKMDVSDDAMKSDKDDKDKDDKDEEDKDDKDKDDKDDQNDQSHKTDDISEDVEMKD